MVLIRVHRRPRPRFQRVMGGLGLLAMLALVLLPTSGRLAGQPPGGAATAVLPAVEAIGSMPAHGHAVAGGHERAHGAGGASSGGTAPEQAPGPPGRSPHEGHADCAYCPLLASVLLAAVLPLPPAAGQRPERWDPPLRSARLDYLHPCGLGSRGPPVG